MGIPAHRQAATIRALYICVLGASLVAMRGWAVIGKHHLDREARTIYVATQILEPRAVPLVPDPAPPCEPPVPVAAPPSFSPAPVLIPVERPIVRSRECASRAPPLA